ncbi:methyltransferase domain-containing protein [Paenibacillus sp. HJL G12]|uniref:Methyltransferase domain-containing protein n=1 Tax=Paenibacillus dendrobii TaxID=2691084 RepID=A0A7X3LGD7_9BACL|nr:methyltransferase domain-containing protein [Paenibacillus dendrobii]MWV42398.1 methyltransferase domain-containing protein [Paenibacillus dendrobii]
MFNELNRRSVKDEYMDDFSSGGEELSEALRHLRRLNRIFGAAGPLLYGIKELWIRTGQPPKLHLMDIGAGSGEINRHILRWADRVGIEARITLVDMTEEACNEARRIFKDDPRVEAIRQNVFDIEEHAADMLISSQFLHHFSDSELPEVTGHMLRSSRYGIVISDIHRHWISWSAVWLTAHLISTNRYIRHDGPLSVAKGFQSSDWKRLSQALSFYGDYMLEYSWKPLFRYSVVISKNNEHNEH